MAARPRRRCWPPAAPSAPTCSPASSSRCSAQVPWRAVPSHAGRDHAAAALVLLPPVQDQLLVAHGHGAPAGADRPPSPRPATHAASRSPSCFAPIRYQVRDYIRRPDYRSGCGPGLQSAWTMVLKRVRAPVSPRPVRRRAIERRRGFVHRPAQRRGRAGRDLPGHGQHRDDVRCPGRARRKTPRAAIAWAGGAEAARRAAGRASAYCQPCVSPSGTPRLAGHALAEAGGPSPPGARGWPSACDWLKSRKADHSTCVGDWAVRRPDVRPGGWAFQYANDALPGRGRHRRGWSCCCTAPGNPGPTLRAAIARARGVDRRHAEQRRRLGRLRAGEHPRPTSTTSPSPTTAPCSTRRPPT